MVAKVECQPDDGDSSSHQWRNPHRGRAATLRELLRRLGLDPARVAVELDRRIVKQAQWSDIVVEPGAQIEIVQFVGGG